MEGKEISSSNPTVANALMARNAGASGLYRIWSMRINNSPDDSIARGKWDRAEEKLAKYEKSLQEMAKVVPEMKRDYAPKVEEAKGIVARGKKLAAIGDWIAMRELEKEAYAFQRKWNRPPTEADRKFMQMMEADALSRQNKPKQYPKRRTPSTDGGEEWLD